MANHLEQLVSEWLEFKGYFVRRNVKVGKLAHGGHEGELDIVAYHPIANHLIQIEPSIDAHTWEKREERIQKKFDAGRKYIIPKIFPWLPHNKRPEAAQEMRAGPSEPTCRSRFQTTLSCSGQMPGW